jgi:hypothetical protein
MTVYTTFGVDLHKWQLNTIVVDEGVRIMECRELATNCRQKIAEYFGSCSGRAYFTVENFGFYQWFGDLLRAQVGALHLPDPAGAQSHAGRKAKTDGNEAGLPAMLSRHHRLTMAHVT